MKTIVVIFTIASVAFCKPAVNVPDPSEIEQDVFGNYRFSSNDIAQQAHQLDDGTVVGSYSYIDKDGVLQRAEYTADENGFHIAATNIPVAVYPTIVQDTPEVAAAKAKHLAEVEAVKQRNLLRQQADLAKKPNRVVLVETVPAAAPALPNQPVEVSRVVVPVQTAQSVVQAPLVQATRVVENVDPVVQTQRVVPVFQAIQPVAFQNPGQYYSTNNLVRYYIYK